MALSRPPGGRHRVEDLALVRIIRARSSASWQHVGYDFWVSTVFRVNSVAVVSETMGEEVIVIHLESGAYFTINGSGVEIWEQLGRGTTITDCATALAASHGADRSEVITALERFFASLAREDLIVPTSETPRPTETPRRAEVPFVAPQLERFLDMQTLIQLDPILDVDDAGWPYPNST
jgi:Coenzyme PQQ synthesis protein D (PqqD)